jgi:3-deoxy-7-phosphoheptulonate synthase / chorismate mutase
VSAADDPVLREFRKQISDTDRAILDAVNARIELVARIKAHKETHGIAFLDPERERTMLDDLARENHGPLSPEGLRDLFGTILDLSKREVASDGRPG